MKSKEWKIREWNEPQGIYWLYRVTGDSLDLITNNNDIPSVYKGSLRFVSSLRFSVHQSLNFFWFLSLYNGPNVFLGSVVHPVLELSAFIYIAEPILNALWSYGDYLSLLSVVVSRGR